MVCMQSFISSYYKFVVGKHKPGEIIKADHSNIVYRLVRSFENSIENLGILTLSVVLALLVQINPIWFNALIAIYFVARIIHWISYILGNQKIRSPFFMIGFFSNVALILGVIFKILSSS